MADSKPKLNRDIEQYKHKDKTRLNNPQVGVVNGSNEQAVKTKKYSYDPHLDPTLVWTGKNEQEEVNVDTVSIHVHERIDPKTIINQVHKNSINSYAHNVQFSLFDKPFDSRPLREEISFYEHKNAWANRLIAGDSLLVMNSLLEKEGMAGQVQMVYIDPPYGIKYGSNFQPFVGQRNVQDGKDTDLTSEPEMIKAFRDTWELGIHSYLSYLRDRLLLARELLNETGSVFLQISDENVHHIKELCDEIFGAENFVSIIIYKKGGTATSATLSNVADFIVWYAKSKPKMKYRQLFENKSVGVGASTGERYDQLEAPDGSRRPMTKEEKAHPDIIPNGYKAYKLSNPCSQHENPNHRKEPLMFEGKEYYPPKDRQWSVPIDKMYKLIQANRIVSTGKNLAYVMYIDDYPVMPINNIWTDFLLRTERIYVVQTSEKVIERCMLMCSDPGDLTLDITCGSGTTATVAERWGRRWITCDTSRVAIHLAKQRLMTSTFDWYKLAFEQEGVGAGFVYKTIPHVMLKTIANDEPPAIETLYDKPEIDKSIVRVSGPFTVEAIPAVTTRAVDDVEDIIRTDIDESVARTGETARINDWKDELQKTGVRTKAGDKIEFSRVELLSGTRFIHAEGETIDGKHVFISFGQDHAPLEQTQVEMALDEATQLKPKPDIVLFAAFQFDPEAAKDIDEIKWDGIAVLKVQMNTDLLTSDLRKAQNESESFWLVGQPDVTVEKTGADSYCVSVEGFDYYNPKTGEVEGGQAKDIAMWMLDTDYDGRSIFPTQVFFPMAGPNDGWNKLAKTLKAELDPDLIEKFKGTKSIEFSPGQYKRCAIKIVDNRGIESFCIKNLE